MPQFTEVAYDNVKDFVFGTAKYPVTLKNGIVIGGGKVIPEVNFTLPPMAVSEATWPEVIRQYREIAEGISIRAKELEFPAFVAEIEVLPPMTFNPKWGAEVCKTVVDVVKKHEGKGGAKGAVRLTPVDIREGKGVTHMWRGSHWDRVLEAFELAADAGADLLAIESIGGKEVHDEANMYADIAKSIFALGVIGARDMEKLWTEIVRIAKAKDSVASGDTACGFANTAMVLAERNMIPKVFSAAVRAVASVRTLVAVEVGAVGPDKDCGYEGPFIKAISGTPISMEGRSAAGAHLSSVGNVAGCVCDLWSNESIQNIKLLSGFAPTVGIEQLIYDARLFNAAIARGPEATLLLRDLHAESDSQLNPEAYILQPEIVIAISKELVKERGHYAKAKKAAEQALLHIQKGCQDGKLILSSRETDYVESLLETVADLPSDEGKFIDSIAGDCEKFDPKMYDM
ncbi:MAG: methanol--corrinoid methyltransferase [Gracilibacteraceae bacterium]|nr:methanol--corrinoid methyltransferase [Gracilibacteraceae bacterium]